MTTNDNMSDAAEVIEETPFGLSLAEARIAELAKLKPLEYEQLREGEAKTLKLRVSFLDKMVQAARPADTDNEPADPFEDVDLWDDPVNGAELLDALHATILRFCVLPEHSAPIMAVWVLHAWAHDASDISPVLAFVSPEKRCGKTTAMSVMGALTPKSMHAVNISTSVLFRVIEKYQPTVLIDEADTFLEANDELRGALNGGHNRLSAYVWRSVGDDHEPRQFRVWAPKCIAMIGKLPDTLEDRALVVHLRRKQDGEAVERFRADRVQEFMHLRRKAARWADDNCISLGNADPAVPGALNDRAQDNARAICAIADLAGGSWPEMVRSALVGAAGQVDDEPQSAGVLLLRDVAEIFESRGTSRIGSTQLCEALCGLEESPWADWRRGASITTRGIAKLLKPFGITPQRDREQRYYGRADFADAFARYLSDGLAESVTSVASVTHLPSVTKNINENNAVLLDDACDATFAGHGDNRHANAMDFAAPFNTSGEI
jgi:putative DNA primase/helicase